MDAEVSKSKFRVIGLVLCLLHCVYSTDVSLLDYLKTEMSFNYLIQNDRNCIYNEKQNRILTVMKTPRELEKVSVIVGLLYAVEVGWGKVGGGGRWGRGGTRRLGWVAISHSITEFVSSTNASSDYAVQSIFH